MINKVVLVGRLVRDIELRKTPNGLSVARFTLACDRVGSKNADGSNNADFITCVAWRQSADYLSSYASKGRIVGVEGHITTGSYDGADGRKVYTTEVTCDRVTLIGPGPTNNQTTANNFVNNGYQPAMNNPVMSNPMNQPMGDFGDLANGPSLDISSDDLPF